MQQDRSTVLLNPALFRITIQLRFDYSETPAEASALSPAPISLLEKNAYAFAQILEKASLQEF